MPTSISSRLTIFAAMLGCSLFLISAIRFAIRGDITGMAINGIAALAAMLVAYSLYRTETMNHD